MGRSGDGKRNNLLGWPKILIIILAPFPLEMYLSIFEMYIHCIVVMEEFGKTSVDNPKSHEH